MGSQTLEILRQGVWASLTGGWFYDPHLDVFSNTFHLYVWLFLLCLPFTIYLYFPPTLFVWLAYCSSIVLLFGTIKCVNHALHCVYDTSECHEEPGQNVCQQKSESEKKRASRNKRRDPSQDQMDLGIELQVLNGKTDTPPVECSSRNSYIEPNNIQNVDADSITSDYARDKPSSTIDLKVEIHRKNSSESSEETSQLNKPMISNINVHVPELLSPQEVEARYRSKLNAMPEWRVIRQKCVAIAEEDRSVSRKLSRHASEDSRSRRCRHSKQKILGKTGSESQIKQTGSIELEQHVDEFHYWKSNQSVRRLNSNSIPLETHLINDHPQSLEIISKKDDNDKNKIPSHPQSLEVIPKRTHQQLIHPQSLETIGASNKNSNNSDDNNLPLHPQSLETINSKKVLTQNTLKRNQLQLLPFLSGSEIVHSIAEQSDEQFTNENSGAFTLRDSYSPLLTRKEIEYTNNSNRDRSLSTGGSEDRFLSRFIGDTAVDNNSANSRDALLEDPEVCPKRRFSNASQSSSELSDGESRREKRRQKRCEKLKSLDDPLTGSIVGINWLFENGEFGVDTWANKNLHTKEPDSGSSSTTTLSIENEVQLKRKLLLTSEVDSKRQQGAIPKQSCSKITSELVNESTSSEASRRLNIEASRRKPKRKIDLNRERKKRKLEKISGSNNELSTLLPSPAPPLLAALLNSGGDLPNPNILPEPRLVRSSQSRNMRNHRRRLKRSNRTHRGTRLNRDDSLVPLTALFGLLSNGECHLATSHNDTSEGAVHCFRDDNGRWLAYTFDEKGSGFPSVTRYSSSNHNEKLLNTLLRQQINQNLHSNTNWELPDSLSNSYSSLSLNSAGLTVIIDTPPALSSPTNNHKAQNSLPPNLIIASNPRTSDQCALNSALTTIMTDRNRRLQSLFGNFNPNSYQAEGNQQMPGLTLPIQLEADNSANLSWNRLLDGLQSSNDPKSKQSKHYYKWKLGKFPSIKVRFDRLALLALLDRNLTILETIVATLLAIAVAGLGLMLLQLGFYRDIFAFIFCFVTAGCQYSLLKSVQPDAASPTHGFNRVIVFSRPVYYIIFAGLILIFNEILNNFHNSDFLIYGIRVANYDVILQARNVLLIFLLCFPIVFSLGLFPQINTFLMYLCEHIDIHIFGGNATTSLVSSAYCLLRSFITVMILYGFAYGALREEKSSQHILFSIFMALLMAVSYHLSRSSSDPSVIWEILKTNLWPPEVYVEEKEKDKEKEKEKEKEKDNRELNEKEVKRETKMEIPKESKVKVSARKKDVKINIGEEISDSELIDPLPMKLRSTIKARLKNDLIVCAVIGILTFAIHSSTVFTALQPELNPILWGITSFLGFLLHYIVPQLRKQLPWQCLARPVLRSHEHAQFEVREPVRIMWFEKVYVYLCFVERNILYPVVFLGALTECSNKIALKYGVTIGALLIVICGLKSLRSSYSDPSTRYLVLIFAVLFFKVDFKGFSETFLIDYFVTGIAFAKIYELLLKIRFIVTYIAPWQITWGSAFHAFAQPFSVPHSAMLFLQAGISAIFSTPLNPLLGSAIFISSYVRPVKFWERDYKTRRVDHSNTRMSSHLERNLGADDNNLNSIFYEQLTRSLQHSLYGDLALGRWGNVEQGDCFLLASDYLNCLVHMVQLGNGLVTFQLRGLEFRGTYCQQREVEAISEGIEDNDNCCCCEIGHFSNVLSVNAAFSQRWLAWEVASAKYVLEGYSISDNSAASMLQVFDFRKVLVTYYVKSIIFYTIKSTKLKQWLDNVEIIDALKPTLEKNFVDLDPVFNMNIDEDFDFRASGITRNSFCNVYLDWIQFCAVKSDKLMERSRDSSLVSLCLALSLLGRRVLGAASHNTVSSVEFFLYGLHALFKGDFRITSVRDEWVLHDVDLLRSVVAKGVRMALKLHQDHFMSPEQYEEASALHEAIDNHNQNLVISHEADPLWRNAILSGAPSLLALRHVLDDGIDEYKVIMLNKRFLSFRVIKMNRECVRGLWAGQQQELVYLRNRNPERGSIQNAKQALRNIINSSCDQPIGYPIYVSPLTTSYAETNEQLCSIVGGPLSLGAIKNTVLKLWRRIRRRCGQGCSSGGTASQDDGGFGNDGVYAMTTYNIHSGYSQSGNLASLGGNRGSLVSVGKPTSSTLASLAGLLSSSDMKVESKSETSFTSKLEKEEVLQRVRIMDPNHVYDAINLGRRIDVIWPDEKMRQLGGRSGWQHWVPIRGMEGCVVHRWSPNHRDPNRRSHVDKVILLVKIEEKYVPIAEQGVRDLGAEV